MLVALPRIDLPTEPPLDAEGASVSFRRLHDARFDLDLRLRAIERLNQRRRVFETIRKVGDDQGIGARVDLHGATLRQHALSQECRQFARLRIARRLRQHLHRA